MAALNQMKLSEIVQGHRYQELNRYESYFRCTQYDHREYDWDGNYMGYGDEADIKPGWYIPIKRRKPTTRNDIARTVVKRYTSMLFGKDRWPELLVEGDQEAADFVKALARECRIQARFIEARDFGGSEGTSCLAWAFVHGKPRIEVLNAKNCKVLRWADRTMLRPAEAIYTYSYTRQEFRPETGKFESKSYYFARYWSEEEEIVWDPIPEEIARNSSWASRVQSYSTRHNFGFCPFYWLQNTPNSQEDDGESDYQGCLDSIDSMNHILSSSTKGTIANVDPTLVIKADPSLNTGSVDKGSENAIYSPGGAEYLELAGTAVKSAREQANEIKKAILEVCCCVLADPEKMSGNAQSAAAMRMMYAPMLAQCDIYREQYGELGIKIILQDMLRAAKMLMSGPGKTIRTADGRLVQEVPTIDLPDKVVEEEEEIVLPDGTVEQRCVQRHVPLTPGTSEDIQLVWPHYFPPTFADKEKAVLAAMRAVGEQPIISRKTAVRSVASLFGIGDVNEELERIEEDQESAMERQEAMLGFGMGQAVDLKEETDGTVDEPQDGVGEEA